MDRRYLLAIRYLRMFAYSWANKLTGLNSYDLENAVAEIVELNNRCSLDVNVP
ncbi:hypothetical protein HQ563_07520 [bacterium]|nr:hypothetical protein [bacterium]